jgi:hypothetical protein
MSANANESRAMVVMENTGGDDSQGAGEIILRREAIHPMTVPKFRTPHQLNIGNYDARALPPFLLVAEIRGLLAVCTLPFPIFG